jgi:hypothetical protein
VPTGDGWLHELKHDGYRVRDEPSRPAAPVATSGPAAQHRVSDDLPSSLDDLVGAQQDGGQQNDTDLLGGPSVHGELEAGWTFDG